MRPALCGSLGFHLPASATGGGRFRPFGRKNPKKPEVSWHNRKGQELQPSPKYTDSATSIAHIYEILGNAPKAIEAYQEQLRLLREEWGIVRGEELDEVERAIRSLQ